MRIMALALGAVIAMALGSAPAFSETENTSPIPPYNTGKGAHGGGDPHAKLGPDKLVKIALQHLDEGRKDEALHTLNTGITAYPKESRLLGIRGSIHLQHREYAKALSDFETALAETPDDALLLVNRAQTYRAFNRRDAALADLNRAIGIAPDLIAARFNRGALYVNMNELEKARADFEYCIAVDPNVAAPRFNLAIALDGLGEREKAISEMERFLKVAHNDNWKKIAREQLDAWRNPGSSSGGPAESN